METLNGYKVGSLPINNLIKVSDLIEHEGPILSHFKDANDSNYLFYWVDFDNNFNRWLIWKISDHQLYNYLKGLLSLKELIEEPNKDYIFSVDIDKNINYTNVHAFDLSFIPDAYKPEQDSVFIFSVPEVYSKFIEKYQNSYLLHLKEKALYFTLRSCDQTFLNTIAAVDAGSFLKKISGSFLGFVEENFYTNFKNKISDLTKLRKLIGHFKDVLSPRIVELKYSSFKVGLSIDTLQTVDVKEYIDWHFKILDSYKNEVVDIDYNSENVLDQISKKYSEDARRKIFAPYVDIVNNKNYSFEVENYKKTFTRKYSPLSKSQENIIIPPPSQILIEPKNNKLYNVVIELKEGTDITSISKKMIQSGLLFSQELDEYPLKLTEIKSSSNRIELKEPISFILSIKDNIYYAENNEFQIFVSGNDRESVILTFQKEFINSYFKAKDGNLSKDLEMLFVKIVTKLHTI
jgi:hypothetical protein